MGRVIVNSEKTHRSFVSVVIFEAKKRCLPSGPNNSNYLEFTVDFDLRFDAKFNSDNEVIRVKKADSCLRGATVGFVLSILLYFGKMRGH